MLTLSAHARIFLCKDPIRMRKSFEGLGAAIEQLFPGELFSGAFFIFLNRDRTHMKVLFWDRDGFAIWYKRLERESFARNPQNNTLDRQTGIFHAFRRNRTEENSFETLLRKMMNFLYVKKNFCYHILSMTAAVNHTIESLEKELIEQRAENLYLKEQNAWMLRQIFGRKSERIVEVNREQLKFDGFEIVGQQKAETQTIPAHERKKRTSTGEDTIKLPDDLPVETIVIDIPEEEKVCKETDVPLQKIGEAVSHKLAVRPGSYFLKRIVRPKYAYPKQEEKGVITAPMPDSILPKCRADESLLADIITRKFVDHLPLYRIAEGLCRDDIVISRRLLSQWVVAVGVALRPLYNAMKEQILQGKSLHIDESPEDLFESPKLRQGYMWVLVGGVGADPPYRLYDFYENRKHENAAKVLGSYSGIIHSNKYGAYETHIRKNGNVWCPCWAHIRRKFFEAEMGDAILPTWVLEQIQQLFPSSMLSSNTLRRD
jgi:transposase